MMLKPSLLVCFYASLCHWMCASLHLCVLWRLINWLNWIEMIVSAGLRWVDGWVGGSVRSVFDHTVI